jgi:hypothetical protein
MRGRILFGVVALICFAVDGAIARSSLFLERPGLFTAAITFDLTLGVTIAYWLIVVRQGDAPARTVVPVFVLAVAAATLILPPGHREFAHYARLLAIPFELALVGAIWFAVRAAHQRLAATGIELDIPERIRYALDTPALATRVAEIVATECGIFYYAFASWRRRPFVPRGAIAFSYHKKSGVAGVFYALAAASVVELAAVELLVRLHAPRTANVLVAIGVLSSIWLVGFARAIQLRPHFVARDRLALRFGLRFSADLSPTAVTAIDTGATARRFSATRDAIRFGPGTPNVILRFDSPVEIRGAYGIRRMVTMIGIVVDDPERFVRTLQLEDAYR